MYEEDQCIEIKLHNMMNITLEQSNDKIQHLLGIHLLSFPFQSGLQFRLIVIIIYEECKNNGSRFFVRRIQEALPFG